MIWTAPCSTAKKEIPQAHIEALHRAIEKGVKLVLCTGRPLVGVKPYYDKLGLAQENEYVIVDNGCATHQTRRLESGGLARA